jgi:RNA recognition motif-containing protein
MTTKLYVANVPLDATEDALRAHFASCGGVADVELLHDRQSGRPRGLAHVTMTSPSFTTNALRMDGSDFNGAVLRVSDAPVRSNAEVKPNVKIVLQFRERASMAYDLDCAGVPLTLRVATAEPDAFRVEARSTDGADAVVGVGERSTRREALVDALRAWNVASSASSGRAVDGDAVERAMLGVRAI